MTLINSAMLLALSIEQFSQSWWWMLLMAPIGICWVIKTDLEWNLEKRLEKHRSLHTNAILAAIKAEPTNQPKSENE